MGVSKNNLWKKVDDLQVFETKLAKEGSSGYRITLISSLGKSLSSKSISKMLGFKGKDSFDANYFIEINNISAGFYPAGQAFLLDGKYQYGYFGGREAYKKEDFIRGVVNHMADKENWRELFSNSYLPEEMRKGIQDIL